MTPFSATCRSNRPTGFSARHHHPPRSGRPISGAGFRRPRGPTDHSTTFFKRRINSERDYRNDYGKPGGAVSPIGFAGEGEFDTQVCDAVNRVRGEWERDRRDVPVSRGGRETLKTKVPELERAAAELEAAARTNSDLQVRAIRARKFAYNARHRAERTLLEGAEVPPTR